LGIVENQRGRPDAAAEALAKAIELDPRDFGSRLLAGSVLERQGHREAAAVELRVVAENSRRLELVREAKERLTQLERNGRWPRNPPSQSPVPADRPIR
jgi:predicted TPR repeat methyltransferase